MCAMNLPEGPDVASLPDIFSRWFADRGWQPRAHQLDVLAKAHAGRSVLLIAPTGAGKTLAGFLPSLIELNEGGLHLSPLAFDATFGPSPGSTLRVSPPSPRKRREGKPGGLHTLYISPL